MTAPSGANRILVVQQPVGIAVLVTPWNFPAADGHPQDRPGAGGRLHLHPQAGQRHPADRGWRWRRSWPKAGRSPAGGGQRAALAGSSAWSSPRCCNDPRVRKVSFTGSTEVGRVLLAEAAVPGRQHLDGARRQRAVPGLRRRRPRRRAGRRDGREDAQRRRGLHGGEPVLRRGARSRRSSPPARRADGRAAGRSRADEETQVGPLVNEDTVAKVDELVRRRSRRRGRDHRWHAAGRHGLLLPADRALGRAAGVRDPARGDLRPGRADRHVHRRGGGVRLANDTEFGLVAYVYTGDLARGLRVSEALEAGMVGLNRGLVSDPAAPFGGVKQSGIGREGGHEGMLDYLESKYIAVSW
jgi:succinate-semialdehyde dehydrogenase/glutarate-semialdehyde dehydrogenase